MKLSIITLLCLTFLSVYKVAAQFDFDEEDYEPPTCPEGGLRYYKDCRGSLDTCSRCLGDAERACESATKQSCYGCTSRANGNCNNIEKMCFGNQECQSNEKCLDYKCVYVSS